MGTVWEATDLVLGRRVAVKMPAPHGRLDRTERERLLQEARLAALVTHPGVTAVFDVGLDGERPFVVMELVKGPTLEEALRRRQLSIAEVAWIGAELADALQAIHARDIVHGDVKPGNVILGPGGRPKLTDLGIASLGGEPSLPTELPAAGPERGPHPRTGRTVRYGTHPYAAPEVVASHEPTGASDVFALGVMLGELSAATPEGEAAGVADCRDSPTSRRAPDDTGLAALLLAAERASATDPAARPNASELASALAALARAIDPAHRRGSTAARTEGNGGSPTGTRRGRRAKGRKVIEPPAFAGHTRTMRIAADPEAATTAIIAAAGEGASSTTRLDPSNGAASSTEAAGLVRAPTSPRWRSMAMAAALTGLLAAGAIATAVVSARQHEPPAARPTQRATTPPPTTRPSPSPSAAAASAPSEPHHKHEGHHKHHH
jgi:hypothetical protein